MALPFFQIKKAIPAISRTAIAIVEPEAKELPDSWLDDVPPAECELLVEVAAWPPESCPDAVLLEWPAALAAAP